MRQIYQDHPYPAAAGVELTGNRWHLPPLDWINDLWQGKASSPARILVAGCGTGSEAFLLQTHLPKAKIVGVDFCAGSIEIARRAARTRGLRGVRFAVADLAEQRLARIVGGTFDFISCHGVLSYIPRARAALRNLAELLRPNGALYLGVNGAGHFSTRWRPALAAFGLDPVRMSADERQVIDLFDAFSRDLIAGPARREKSFLPSDLCGPYIRTGSLREWLRDCGSAGLHFMGNYGEENLVRRTVPRERYAALRPRSRAEVAQIADALCPAQFHRLLLTNREVAVIPWEQPEKLAGWRPMLAPHLRDHSWPKRGDRRSALRRLIIRSPLMNLRMELLTPEWVAQVLRESCGQRSLAQILAECGGSLKSATLGKHLYLLHQLYLLNFLPPKKLTAFR